MQKSTIMLYLFCHLLQVVAPRHKQPGYLRARPTSVSQKSPPPGSLGTRAKRKRVHAPPLGRAGDARPQTLPSRSAVSRLACSQRQSATGLHCERGRARAGSIPGLSSLVVPGVQQRVAQDCAVAALRAVLAVSAISLVASTSGQPPKRSALILQLTITTQQLQPSSTAKAQRAQ